MLSRRRTSSTSLFDRFFQIKCSRPSSPFCRRIAPLVGSGSTKLVAPRLKARPALNASLVSAMMRVVLNLCLSEDGGGTRHPASRRLTRHAFRRPCEHPRRLASRTTTCNTYQHTTRTRLACGTQPPSIATHPSWRTPPRDVTPVGHGLIFAAPQYAVPHTARPHISIGLLQRHCQEAEEIYRHEVRENSREPPRSPH